MSGRHEERTDGPPPKSPDELAQDARDMGVLQEDEARWERIIAEYRSRHPEAQAMSNADVLAAREDEDAYDRAMEYLDDHRALFGSEAA